MAVDAAEGPQYNFLFCVVHCSEKCWVLEGVGEVLSDKRWGHWSNYKTLAWVAQQQRAAMGGCGTMKVDRSSTNNDRNSKNVK